MKKTTILRLPSILLILVSTWAQAQTRSLLENIDLSTPRTSWTELKAQITELSKKRNHYLSLGESHLEAKTSVPLLAELARAYTGNFEQDQSFAKTSKACVESGTHIRSLEKEWLANTFSKVEVRNLNSPKVTDFANCYEARYSRHLVYSGFFHQYPWTTQFGLLFDPSPVQNLPHNNIEAQLKPVNGFFVSLIELPFLISLETRRMLREIQISGSPAELELPQKTQALQAAVNSLKAVMTPLLQGPNAFTSKFGIVLNDQQISIRQTFNSPRYFIFTDLEYRMGTSPTSFLDSLSELSNQAIQGLQRALQTQKWAFQQTFLERGPLGEPSTTTIGTLPLKLEGEASLLWFSSSKGTALLAKSLQNKTSPLQCIWVEPTPEKKAYPKSCTEILEGFAAQ